MGDIADYYRPHLMEADFVEQAKSAELEHAYEKGALGWRTKSGKVMLIQDMTDSHINNTYKFLLKKHQNSITSQYVDTVFSIFVREIERRRK